VQRPRRQCPGLVVRLLARRRDRMSAEPPGVAPRTCGVLVLSGRSSRPSSSRARCLPLVAATGATQRAWLTKHLRFRVIAQIEWCGVFVGGVAVSRWRRSDGVCGAWSGRTCWPRRLPPFLLRVLSVATDLALQGFECVEPCGSASGFRVSRSQLLQSASGRRTDPVEPRQDRSPILRTAPET